MSSASAVELTFVFGAIKVAFRFCDQSVIVDLPKFVAADSDGFPVCEFEKKH
jgi:hypothetical protein